MVTIPYIDIFAGPGGLSEGFSRLANFTGASIGFESKLAIEKDPVAVQTLQLRSFYRAFPDGGAPREYYEFIRGQRPIGALALFDEWRRALSHVWNVTLGEVNEETLHARIDQALNGTRNWALLGGPPCQAYSLVGRARMTGIGNEARSTNPDEKLDGLKQAKLKDFATDHRHRLYREYLRIVAAHEPAVFVMENVKGILTAKLRDDEGNSTGLVFEQIRKDLTDPGKALAGDPTSAEAVRRSTGRKYKLYSLVLGGSRLDGDVKNSEFIIRAEDYGIPQKRHRVIILGVRDDINARPVALGPKPIATVEDALSELPALRSAISNEKSTQAEWQTAIRNACAAAWNSISQPQQNAITSALERSGELGTGSAFVAKETAVLTSELGRWFHDGQIGGVIEHQSRSHMKSDLGRYMFAAATAEVTGRSPKLEDWPRGLLPAHKNVSFDLKTGRTVADGFSDRFKVQVWGEPSSTITSHISKDGHYFIHPDPKQCRSLTVREAARLQTFPDNYFFCGNRTQQYHQVGNAVPPYLASQIAGVVAQLFEDAGLSQASDG